ncbi:chaperonin 10-like protein [Phaeosphaeriaceae sp. PMI808]|nr:chaperonin 10-like protein [Phaeosphaeriaceae sp. PMI808]
MRAARYYGKEDIRIEDVDEQKCGAAGQVRIAPPFVGYLRHRLCTNSSVVQPLHTYYTSSSDQRHPSPQILGHELSGTITQLGLDVSSFTLGQHAVVQPTISCGTCEACTAGIENVLSDSVVFPSSTALTLPNTIPLAISALHGTPSISAAPTRPDSTILVLGGSGPYQPSHCPILSAHTTSSILTRATLFARSKETEWVQKDGSVSSLKTACTAPGATVVNVAPWGRRKLPFFLNQARYTAVCGGYRRKDVRAVSGRLAAGTRITRKIQPENLVEDGVKALIRDMGRVDSAVH